ncbi:hypothetical protein AX16_007026 [Volvariella volvacea WC 439]|nr:hypothetical protein AX16_007026 [Volvariella volvacea WC 439]
MYLPLEIINEIIIALATPAYPLQYGHDDETSSALCRLRLCNRAILELTTTHLYRSIRVLRGHQFTHLHNLLRTRQDLANLVESVYLHFNEGNAESLAQFLTLLQPSLRRLFIERVVSRPHWEYYPLCQALMGCQLLEEFCTLQAFEPYLWRLESDVMHWRGDWRGLKRFLAHNVALDHRTRDFIRRHPSVTTVILPLTFWRGLASVLPSTETVAGRLNDVPLNPYTAVWFGYSRTAERILEWKDREDAAPEDNRFQVLEISAYKFQLLDFVRNRILDGRIWCLMDDFVR